MVKLCYIRLDWGPAYIVPGTKRGAMHRWRHLQLERTGFWAVATATTAVDSRSSKDTKSTWPQLVFLGWPAGPESFPRSPLRLFQTDIMWAETHAGEFGHYPDSAFSREFHSLKGKEEKQWDNQYSQPCCCQSSTHGSDCQFLLGICDHICGCDIFPGHSGLSSATCLASSGLLEESRMMFTLPCTASMGI